MTCLTEPQILFTIINLSWLTITASYPKVEEYQDKSPTKTHPFPSTYTFGKQLTETITFHGISSIFYSYPILKIQSSLHYCFSVMKIKPFLPHIHPSLQLFCYHIFETSLSIPCFLEFHLSDATKDMAVL